MHKRPKRKRSTRLVVETHAGAAGVSYQLERVRCGKARCLKLHGPYWYAYVHERKAEAAKRGPRARARVRKLYIGRKRETVSRADVLRGR